MSLSPPKVPPTLFDSLADYPDWLVALCVTIVAAGLIWVLMKLLKWALWLALIVVVAVGAVVVTGLLLG